MRHGRARHRVLWLLVLLFLPGDLRAASTAPFAYISSRATNSVFVLDTATNTVTTSVPVGVAPRGVAVHPGGATVYVANDASATVSVIDARTDAVSATVAVGAGADAVAVHPDGRAVYVTNRDDDTVSVIDTETHRVAATIPVGRQPRGVAASPDGRRVYVTNWGGTSVSVIEAATNTVAATIEIGLPMHPPRKPRGIAVDPSGRSLYIATAGGLATGAVLVVDTITRNVRATIGLSAPAFGLVMHPSGSSVYVTTAAEVKFPGPAVIPPALSIISTATDRVTGVVPLGKSSWSTPHGVAVHPDGETVYVTNEESYALYLVCAPTATVIGTVALPSPSSGFGRFIGPAPPRAASTPAPGRRTCTR